MVAELFFCSSKVAEDFAHSCEYENWAKQYCSKIYKIPLDSLKIPYEWYLVYKNLWNSLGGKPVLSLEIFWMNKNFYFNIYLLINHFYLSYIFRAVCYAIRLSVIHANMPRSPFHPGGWGFYKEQRLTLRIALLNAGYGCHQAVFLFKFALALFFINYFLLIIKNWIIG